MTRCPCAKAVHGEDALHAFDPDLYDCTACGHMIGDHYGPDGECAADDNDDTEAV